MLKDYKNKKNKEEKVSGINFDLLIENEILFEEIVVVMELIIFCVGNVNSKKDD